MQEQCKYSALTDSCLTWYLSLDFCPALRSAFHIKEYLCDFFFKIFFSLRNLFGIMSELKPYCGIQVSYQYSTA